MPPQDEAVSLTGTPPEGPHPERVPAEVPRHRGTHLSLQVTFGSGDESCFTTSPSSSSNRVPAKVLLMPITAEAV